MKIDRERKIPAVVLALVALAAMIVSVHGCSVSSYGGKKLASISITPGSSTIAAGTVQQFKATGHYSDSTTTDLSSSVTWSTLDASVATISPTTGLATAVASAGTCTITATAQGLTGEASLQIKNLPLQGIAITPATPTTNKGMTLQFKASGVFSDGTDTISNQDITTLVSWTSSTASVASIDASSGLATGVAAGTTDITAQWLGQTATVTLTVSNAAVQSIAVSASGVVQVNAAPVQLTAMVTFDDGSPAQDMTSQVAWNSENPDKATVDSAGVITALMAGKATFTATLGGKTGSILVTVYAAPGH